ncbi:hypothetical protein Rhe02_02360 [Rhizocola hellebori]|uniref:YcaO domain-containing protein n=1 Tax=Rhizocola hellebori TaxID=1392758 RepID=A0A8J3VC20_9ACTN|nr:YcaO-like family protein [Rhizocola hellebori]GIH02169.1 hypothetical protein Rhe02_02360 [Rhizocola hellebori]
MLADDVLVVAGPEGFLLHTVSDTIKVDLDRPGDPELIAAAARGGPAGLLQAGLIAAEESEELRRLLAARGIEQHAAASGGLPEAVLPLARVASDYGQSAVVPRGVLVVTSLEALWLPPETDLPRRKWALRMFISRQPDQTRLAAYGALAAGRVDLSVAGDFPGTKPMRSVRQQVASSDEISTWSLLADPPEQTGSLRDFPAKLDDANGRLSIAQAKNVDEWRLDDGETIYCVTGQGAQPNLAATRPFAQMSFVSGCIGADGDLALARKKCIVEGIERFCMGDLPPNALHRACAAELAQEWLDPHDIISYHPAHRARLGLLEFDPHRPEWWVVGQRAGRPLWVPAALVFSPFPHLPGWLHDGYASSNAAAAHVDPDQAVLRAWLEGVERDAFQRARSTEDPPPRLDLSTLPPRLRALTRFVRGQAELTLIVLSGAESIPVFVAMAVGENGLALGMCAAADRVTGARKALFEACAELRFPFTHEPLPEEVENPLDHGALYRDPENVERLRWLRSGPVIGWQQVAMPSVQPPARVVTYVFPSPAQPGLTVVKALDPELSPMTFGYDTDPTGHTGFAQGYLSRGIDFSTPLFPHPFA